MTMASATLSTQLQTIEASTEAGTITAWTLAWQAYFIGAVAGSGPGVAFSSSSIFRSLCRSAMAAQMTGISVSGQSAAKVQAGIIGWWDYLVANPGSAFSGASSITKPAGLTGIAAALPAIFATNQSTLATAAVACGAIAASIHSNNASGSANIGGSQTIT